MASIQIREIPEQVLDALEERAAAAGMSREAWLREQLAKLAAGPVVRRTYALRAFDHATGATLQLGRYPDGSAEIIKQRHLSDAALEMRDDLLALLRRNEPGDREQATRILGEHFEQVFETTV